MEWNMEEFSSKQWINWQNWEALCVQRTCPERSLFWPTWKWWYLQSPRQPRPRCRQIRCKAMRFWVLGESTVAKVPLMAVATGAWTWQCQADTGGLERNSSHYVNHPHPSIGARTAGVENPWLSCAAAILKKCHIDGRNGKHLKRLDAFRVQTTCQAQLPRMQGSANIR